MKYGGHIQTIIATEWYRKVSFGISEDDIASGLGIGEVVDRQGWEPGKGSVNRRQGMAGSLSNTLWKFRLEGK